MKNAAKQSWYVVFTKPGDEFRAHGNLLKQGFDPFLPLSKKPVDDKLRPLFPRYLFIPKRDTIKPVSSTLGVLYLLKYGEQLAIVADDVIENIRAEIDPDIGAVPIKDNKPPRRQFQQGQEIRIVGGAYIGLEGLYVSSAKERVTVLLSLFGERKVRATVSEKSVA